jgi:hypothetical protein
LMTRRALIMCPYVVASSAAAAQMVAVIQDSLAGAPDMAENPYLVILTDILVIVCGSLLWRVELSGRAVALKRIWQGHQVPGG